MLGTIGASILTGLGSAAIQGIGASKAARAQERAAQSQVGLQRDIYEQTSANFQPFLQSGQNAMQAYNYEMGLGEAPEGYGGMQDSPSYQFMMNQGVEDIQSSAAMRGNLQSGATGTALERYRMGLASQESNNWLNRLASQAGAGQAAAGQQAQAGQFYAQGAGQAYGNIGDAQAAGAIGVGNAITSGINQGIGMYGYMNQLQRPPTSANPQGAYAAWDYANDPRLG